MYTTMKTPISAIPTNIITGFLGAGKTSAILHLLKQKPAKERWAVLVNEFGEIGVDGSFFEGQHAESSGVFVREVPGGCMCCTAGLPMQIALNQLLLRAKPSRLLIEPTGLGHPLEVLQSLSTSQYQNILDLQKIITLVDARKLSDERYTSHQTFNQQIAIADTVVGNKLDLYQAHEQASLENYVKQHGAAQAKVIFTQQGELSDEYLMGKTAAIAQNEHHHHQHHHHHHSSATKTQSPEGPLPECGYLKAVNKGEGFYSIGWRFSPKYLFSHDQLFSLLSTIKAERMKAVFITEQGIFSYNSSADNMTQTALDECSESRIEIIANTLGDTWEAQLMACITQKA